MWEKVTVLALRGGLKSNTTELVFVSYARKVLPAERDVQTWKKGPPPQP